MSGHSKWATIHRQKEVKDSKRGAVFTKLANMITVAVKEGGGIGDPDKNFKLRLAVDKARAANMPKDNIQRAIDRALGASGADFSEAVFEGFLPGGVGVLIQTLSDNKLRSAQLVREVLDKNGATLAAEGAVSHGFVAVGELVVNKKPADKQDLEDQLLNLIDAGAEDVVDKGSELVVYCGKSRLGEVKQNVEKLGFELVSAELSMRPSVYITVEQPEVRRKVEDILGKLEDLDDVAKVWTNYRPGVLT